jgi:LytS/YehU family sensor histidine kinase
MLGLDSMWRETNATFLDYPSLPSGGYTFQMQAINKFGVQSKMLSLPFRVEMPFWEAVWFRGLAFAIVVLLTWLLVSRRIRNIRKQQNEREELVRQRAEMENKALQAQMNPHFIFNCLNSIQQFMFDQDMMQTNEYVSGFARLIRATLNHSSRSFISLEEEIEYLSDYLVLEKMRFKEKMNYYIELDPVIDQFNTVLPPMLIQPYVENAMRHGLRNKPGGDGFIRIMIRKEGSDLVIIVEDNGIGREKAMEYKTKEHIEYQSKGISMTASRISILGAVYGVYVRVSMEDRMTNGCPDGTKVTVIVPEFSHAAF